MRRNPLTYFWVKLLITPESLLEEFLYDSFEKLREKTPEEFLIFIIRIPEGVLWDFFKKSLEEIPREFSKHFLKETQPEISNKYSI